MVSDVLIGYTCSPYLEKFHAETLIAPVPEGKDVVEGLFYRPRVQEQSHGRQMMMCLLCLSSAGDEKFLSIGNEWPPLLSKRP
jgi:hypothetical protein